MKLFALLVLAVALTLVGCQKTDGGGTSTNTPPVTTNTPAK